FLDTCRLAEKLGVTRLTLLAGLPEAAPGDQVPNWILYPFPAWYSERYEWQWEERLVPFWREHGKMAEDHGVRLCFELHPGDMVFNPEALFRLRSAVGPVIGCNLDPSHLFWQGMDIIEVVRTLGDAIYHVHAKDTGIDHHNVRVNGYLGFKEFQYHADRAWLFRTVGYGHDEGFWRDFVTALRLAGYDDVLSIEHEDPLMDPEEGLHKAATLLESVLMRRPPAGVWFE
ncbi:MAG: sugar phosphate isomerase/epimerase, partial [Dehalococcoidia bacterium]|nr:sugar phosphate isomerase/epimerase [Dehalococcoidia bacterium]